MTFLPTEMCFVGIAIGWGGCENGTNYSTSIYWERNRYILKASIIPMENDT